ncbi:XRN 5'-3' exonuclease [Indivirus ILV1]|uniref:XRN 5'-3' exonuclease n=1 Tax=Indivirus ILV1 TaxID=1977633 RepID=A0A1V0SE08_9VIRU|nr:XRN 5'-3' exonuclease [Indivirus ILV1]
MGVPGFFAWLLKKHKKSNIISNNLKTSVNVLYIDANCLIHPQCFKVLHFYNDTLDIEKLEKKMFKRILNYVDYLIGYVNPTEEVYISIDGVAPAAKMTQQRKRRYKTIIDNEIYGKIKKKYGKESTNIWSNTAITPGTVFMEKLHQEFLKYIKQNRTGLKIKYTYSSYHTIGEGEHKILQDIKYKSNQDKTYVIYGLDADLIFLALASQKNNIFLLREEMYLKKDNNEKEKIIDIVTDVSEDLNFVSMDETKKSINCQIREFISSQKESKIDEKIDFTNDFIVLCYFLGNDFLPNLPSIEIKNDGIDFLLDNYSKVYLTLGCGITYFSSDNILEINNIFLGLFFENLAKYEDYYFKVKYPKWVDMIKNRFPPSDDPYEKEIWEVDTMRRFKIHDPIKLGHDEPELWKFRFYEYYYGVVSYQKEHISEMCYEYIKGLVWNTKYYFEKCSSWSWYYKYAHAPFVSDLSKYFKNNDISLQKIIINNENLISPFIQLLAVLPSNYSNLLPSKYGHLMTNSKSPIIDIYPTSFVTDMLYKDSFHKCIPILPNINIDRIINAVKEIELNNSEKERNIISDNFTIKH